MKVNEIIQSLANIRTTTDGPRINNLDLTKLIFAARKVITKPSQQSHEGDDVVERVARAIAKASSLEFTKFEVDDVWQLFTDQAKAAIAALGGGDESNI